MTLGWFLLGALVVAIVICAVIGVAALGELVGILMDATFPDD
jgi:hypothetical protein